MPDRPFRAVDELIRRVERVAADRPDQLHVPARMISIVGESDVDPYAVRGTLIEGAAHTVARHIPTERQADATEALLGLLAERLTAHMAAEDDR